MRNREERFFLILLFLALAGIAILATGIWYLQVVGVTSVTGIVLTILAGLLSLTLLVLVIGFSSLLLTLIFERPITFLLKPTRLAVEYLFPLAMHFGQFLGFPKDGLQRAFIQVSNHLVGIGNFTIKGHELLILLPHCIQYSDCEYKVTSDVENCRRCGQCQLAELLVLKEKYGCHLAVATGGTLARIVIRQIKPKAIVAVACERDLTSGIQDTYPLPVVGVINIRPEGPCVNTQVNLKEVENAVQKFLGRSE